MSGGDPGLKCLYFPAILPTPTHVIPLTLTPDVSRRIAVGGCCPWNEAKNTLSEKSYSSTCFTPGAVVHGQWSYHVVEQWVSGQEQRRTSKVQEVVRTTQSALAQPQGPSQVTQNRNLSRIPLLPKKSLSGVGLKSPREFWKQDGSCLRDDWLFQRWKGEFRFTYMN